MRIPFSWLKEFLSPSSITSQYTLNDLTAINTATYLTDLGLEVDKIETFTPLFSGVVVAHIVSISAHPTNPALKLLEVSDGVKNYQVVCSAPNCTVGMLSLFAPPGAILPKFIEGQKTTSFVVIAQERSGVLSEGMLCSEKELGLSQDGEGIAFLGRIDDPTPSNGIICQTHISYPTLGLDALLLYPKEEILEISLTPNLGHCWSVLGVARELATHLGCEVRLPAITPFPVPSLGMDIQIDAPDYCSYYSGVRLSLEGKIPSTPYWIARRLQLVGNRSKGLVVDITNYLMVELGHPLHAFDWEKILLKGPTGQIHVRYSRAGELCTTLDGIERILPDGVGVIASNTEILALGGLFGCAQSGITAASKEIFLESALFSQVAIRLSSKGVGISTDASKRFERGVDPTTLPLAQRRTINLLQTYLSAKIIALGSAGDPSVLHPHRQIKIDFALFQRILGFPLTLEEISRLLKKATCIATPSDDSEGSLYLLVSIPPHRNDLNAPIDLVEEVLRLHGFTNLPAHTPSIPIIPSASHSLEHRLNQRIIAFLSAQGWNQAINCDLIAPEQVSRCPTAPEIAWLHLTNSSSLDHSILRPSLLHGLLQNGIHHLNHEQNAWNLFEIGRIYHKSTDGQIVEKNQLMLCNYGSSTPLQWTGSAAPADFYQMKGALEAILSRFLTPGDLLNEQIQQYAELHPGQQLSYITPEGKVLAIVGTLHPKAISQLFGSGGLPHPVCVASIDLDLLASLLSLEVMQPIPPLPSFPGSQRDWTYTADETLQVGKWLDNFKKKASSHFSYLEEVQLLGIYRNPSTLGEGKKNVTLRLYYRCHTHTLTQAEVEAQHQLVLEKLELETTYLN